jgi:hypothetical protein
MVAAVLPAVPTGISEVGAVVLDASAGERARRHADAGGPPAIGARGWTRKHLGEESGIPEQTIMRIFRCERDMSVTQLGAMVDALGITGVPDGGSRALAHQAQGLTLITPIGSRCPRPAARTARDRPGTCPTPARPGTPAA